MPPATAAVKAFEEEAGATLEEGVAGGGLLWPEPIRKGREDERG